MQWNKHFGLRDAHADLSPSNYHWVNYPDEKLFHRFTAMQAANRGTRIHAWAAEAIRLGLTQSRSKKTVNMYINDCIGWRMVPEQLLFYSPNCFGTADGIGFRNKVLRVSDLKNGITQTGMMQLKLYAALFCLEYGHKPQDIKIELRIYQSNEVRFEEGDPDEITHLMARIQYADQLFEEWKKEVDL